MNSHVIFHTQQHINCIKIINRFVKGDRYIKYYNKYLIPYQCREVDQSNRMIYGRFVYPMWNTIERSILTSGAVFKNSYIKGDGFVTEFNHSVCKDYHIFGQIFAYANSIKAYEYTLQPNSILLFSVDRVIAEPLIQSHLL